MNALVDAEFCSQAQLKPFWAKSFFEAFDRAIWGFLTQTRLARVVATSWLLLPSPNVPIRVPSCPAELEAAAGGISRGGFRMARVPATWRIVVVVRLQAFCLLRKSLLSRPTRRII